MDIIGDYQKIVIEVFRKEAEKAFANGFLLEFSGREDPMGLPFLREALAAVGSDCEIPDDAAMALSEFADRLAEKAEKVRGKPEWAETAIAMGWARTAAVRVWDLTIPGPMPA